MTLSARFNFLIALVLILLLIIITGIIWYFSSRDRVPAMYGAITTVAPALSSTSAPGQTSANKIDLILQPGYNLISIGANMLSPNDGATAFHNLASQSAYGLLEGQWQSVFAKNIPIVRGGAYWLKSEGEVLLIPATAIPADETKPFTVRLQKGWNAVGNPFNKEIIYNPLVKTDKGATTIAKAIEAKILTSAYISDPVAKEYKLINPADKLPAFRGFVIKSGGTIDLVFEPN